MSTREAAIAACQECHIAYRRCIRALYEKSNHIKRAA